MALTMSSNRNKSIWVQGDKAEGLIFRFNHGQMTRLSWELLRNVFLNKSFLSLQSVKYPN